MMTFNKIKAFPPKKSNLDIGKVRKKPRRLVWK